MFKDNWLCKCFIRGKMHSVLLLDLKDKNAGLICTYCIQYIHLLVGVCLNH